MCTNIVTKEYFVYVAVFTAHLGIFLVAVASSSASPVLYKLNHLEDNPLKRKITTSEQALLLSVRVCTSWTGAIAAGCIARKFGRKPAFIIMTLPEIISYVIFCLADNISMILIARAINGLGNGAMYTLNPIYCGEITEAKHRGQLAGSVLVFLNIGHLFSLSVGPYTTFFQFHAILALLPVLHIILLLTVLPETPYFLIGKDYNEAKKTLRDLRGVEDVGDELTKIQSYVDQKNDVTMWDVIRDKGMRRSLLIGCGLMLFMKGSGASVIMTFGQLIFDEASDFFPSALGPIIIGVAQVLFAFIAPAVLGKTGRKTLLILSEIGISVSLFIFGMYFVLKDGGHDVSSISWLPIVCLVFFTFAFCIGIGPATYVVLGEVYPLKTKEAATSIAAIVGTVSTLMETNIYNVMSREIGIGPSFWIISFVSVLGTLFVIFIVFETKGKTLHEIQEIIDCLYH